MSVRKAVEMSAEYHSMKKEQLLESLKVTESGLSTEEAERRLQEFGTNELVTTGGISPLQIFLGQFKDIFVVMLLFAIVVSVAINEIIDAATIASRVTECAVCAQIGCREFFRKDSVGKQAVPESA